jgi:TRAP-type C4-dicarboxylate transport system permease small subunit
MTGLQRASNVLARIEDGIAGAVLTAVLAVVVYELALRSLFGQSNLWTDEISRVLLIALTYVSAIGLSRDGAHVRVGIFADQLGEHQRAILVRFCDLLCLIFAVSATWLGYKYVRESALFGLTFAHSNLPFPIWVAQSIIPIGFAAISLRLALRLFGIAGYRPSSGTET